MSYFIGPPGLLISTAIVGVILAWLTPLSMGQALLFGSLISATDPVAVIALFKELGAPKQLTILVEGESLFNDATAIVAFNIIFATIAAGQVGANGIQQAAIAFLVSFVGGIIEEKIKQAQAVVNHSPELAIAFQTRILERVGFVVQNDTVDELAKQGVISQSVLSQVAQTIAVE